MVYDLFDEPKDELENDASASDTSSDGSTDAFVPAPFDPPTTDESYRRSGLAWSMGIVFFGSVIFMLGLGWLADLVLGSSPWGLVSGIVLGSIIGFVQFFRISSQIFARDKSTDNGGNFLSGNDDNGH